MHRRRKNVVSDYCKAKCKDKGYEMSATAISLAYAIGKNLTPLEREFIGSFFLTLGQNLFSLGSVELICQVMCEEKMENNSNTNEIITDEEASV